MEKITVEWANADQNVILVTYQVAGWTWEDAFVALDTQHALVESSPAAVVDVVIDATHSRWMPGGGGSVINGIRKVSATRHPRQGKTMIVGARGILASMADLMMRLIDVRRREFQFVNTVDEAYAALAQIRAQRQNEKAS